jgi:hypothetical protein
MRRDLNLIRRILLCLESNPGEVSGLSDDDTIRYHMRLMVEAGFLSGNIIEHSDGYAIFLNEHRMITNQGHDLIDVIRADTLWRKICDRVSILAGGVTLEVLKEVAVQEARGMLGLSKGP